ncbi:hypothetical protein HDZ31DRAFT_76297 [Schizophyllum fasciatum]
MSSIRKIQTPRGTTLVVVFPKTQDAIDNPELWNEQWEEFYRHPEYPEPLSLVHGYEGIRNPKANLDFFFFSDLLEQTRELHRHVLSFTKHQAFVDAFACAWMRAKPEDRKRHAIHALATVCGATDNINNSRAYCPEILNMDNLAYANNGIGFVRLVDNMRHADISTRAPHEIRTHSPQWDAFLADWAKTSHTKAEELCMAEVLGLRFKMLCWITLYVTWSFMGLELPKIHVVKERYPKGDPAAARSLKEIEELERVATMSDLKKAYGSASAADARAREYERDHRKMMASRRVACARCGSFEKKERFKRCNACWTEKRDVPYCSRDCQVEDWRTGRHRVICGKPIDLQTAHMYAAITRPRPKTERKEDEPITPDEMREIMRLYKVFDPELKYFPTQ